MTEVVSKAKVVPLFIATERFDPSDGEKWSRYFEWAKIPSLTEVVSLDGMLCPRLVKELADEDWNHIVCEDFRLDYFYHLNYLLRRVAGISRKQILGLYRNADAHITEPPDGRGFRFIGYDLIEEATQISALTNCGGFADVFSNEELNQNGLLDAFERAREVKLRLSESYPHECHAQCEMYAVWRLDELE